MIAYEDFANTLAFTPTAEQEAVIRSEDHAIAVIAGAGSGKTLTMSQRIAWHVVNGNVRPDQVLGLTFTTKAAGELAERVELQLRQAAAAGLTASRPEVDDADAVHRQLERPTIATYNSFASEIASSYSMLIGEDPRARLITDAERFQVMGRIVNGIDPDNPRYAVLRTLAMSTIITRALHLTDEVVGNEVDASELRAYLERELTAIYQVHGVTAKRGTATEQSRSEQSKLSGMIKALNTRVALTYLVEEYLAFKKEHSLIEFADQIVRARKILAAVPEVGQDLRSRYKLILLDEYQDTSSSQAQFIEAAFSNSWSVCAVGDPNQAIYSWRGASSAALSDFMDSFGVAKNLTLSTAFRNGRRILNVANALTGGKLRYPTMTVKTLQPGPMAQDGRVVHVHRTFREDAYRDMVDYFARAFATAQAEAARAIDEGREPTKIPTAAILCRARSYMDFAIAALEEAGVPYEMVGGQMLIDRQEIRLVRSVLGLSVNPGRNDLLVPLLTFFAIGAKDVAALSAFARSFAKSTRRELRRETSDELDVDANLVEALAALPEDPVPGMSAAGHRRLVALASILERARQNRHLAVPEAISAAIGLLDLRAYAKARLTGGARVTAALASFVKLGAAYANDMPGSRLDTFVEWVDMVEAHERVGEDESGSDTPVFGEWEIEPESGVVQLLTIHAAKGLEWDLVGIPDMKAGGFDEVLIEKLWQESRDGLPYAFRQDRLHLPDLSVADILGKHGAVTPLNKASILEEVYEHRHTTFTRYHLAEGRRLAYVATTRPRSLLILSSYDLVDSAQAESALKKLARAVGAEEAANAHMPQNVFISDVAQLVEAHPANDQVLTGADLELIALTATAAPGSQQAKMWPRDVDRRLERDPVPTVTGDPSVAERWKAQARVIIAERQAPPSVRGLAREYLTASDVVALAQDPHSFLADQYRPIPRRPSRAARTGVLVHAAIAHSFDAAYTMDIDSVADPDEMPIDATALDDERLAELFARFEDSRYATRPALAVEEAVDVRVGGYPVRCVIDAVIDTTGVPGLTPVTIVDWKTGRRPSAHQVASRQFQLGLYRLAWSRATGTPLEEIGACFYYLGEDDPARRELHAGDMREDQIVDYIRTHLGQGVG